ncbi:MAG: hypothetical protein MZV64_09970 [Ignavibacteriales bacterium]|nr:hypothetical protein [Ignavibacteriales bacterium]
MPAQGAHARFIEHLAAGKFQQGPLQVSALRCEPGGLGIDASAMISLHGR